METRVVNYKGYVIMSEQGEKRGIFFKKPLQKVGFETLCPEYARFSAYDYADKIKYNTLRRLYERLIGNGWIVKNIHFWLNNDEVDFNGFEGNILCFPIYFKREYRKLTAYSCADNNIAQIRSHGYENEFNECAGKCEVERTKVILKNGKSYKFKRKDDYHFTYEHIIKEIIDTGIIEKI